MKIRGGQEAVRVDGRGELDHAAGGQVGALRLVDQDHQPGGEGQVADPRRLGQPADPDRLEVERVGTPQSDHLQQVGGLADVLVDHHRERGVRPDPGQLGDGPARLLEVGVDPGHGGQEPQRLGDGPAPVRVAGQEARVGRHGVDRGVHPLGVLERVAAELQLPVPEPEVGHAAKLAGHVRGRAQADGLERGKGMLLDPAEQPRDGLAQQLAAQVPHGVVDGRLAGQVPDQPVVHGRDQHVGLERVARQNQVGELADRGPRALREPVQVVAAERARLAVADGPVRRGHLDHGAGERVSHAAVRHHVRAVLGRDVDGEARQLGDSHKVDNITIDRTGAARGRIPAGSTGRAR